MNEQYETNTTEVVERESWCSHCKQDVREWVVTFESSIHTDSGYDKVRRCPHCKKMCLEDSSFSLGCFFFFVGLFGTCLYVPPLEYLGFDLNLQGETGAFSVIFFVFAVVHGYLLSAVSTALFRTYKFRHRLAAKRAREG